MDFNFQKRVVCSKAEMQAQSDAADKILQDIYNEALLAGHRSGIQDEIIVEISKKV